MATRIPTLDPRIDDYIARAAPFAHPVLEHLRAAIHQALPDVGETIKWGHPFFMVDGRILGNMAAFKAHCSLGFWRAGRPIAQAAEGASDEAMGQFGRITTVADLPAPAALRRIIQQAARATREQANAPAPARRAPSSRSPREALPVPPDLDAGLRANKAAKSHFDAFSPTERHEYIEWLQEAKRVETRARRLDQAIEWISEGKTRHWKYR